jgi:hypothetical protein
VSVLAGTDASATLDASSLAALDLGCGSLPAASSGSTFVTRLDASGACVFARALAAPGLTVALDPSGHVVVSGLVGATAVDLGGGPLQPLGTTDLVLAELDGGGNHLWSQRFGSPGASLALVGPVRVSGAGNLYLRVQPSGGTVDFGGGPLGNDVIASISGAGAYRWSRPLPFSGTVLAADFDGCGAFMVTSQSHNFDPGCGPVVPPTCTIPEAMALTCAYPTPDYVGVARYAP